MWRFVRDSHGDGKTQHVAIELEASLKVGDDKVRREFVEDVGHRTPLMCAR